MVGEVVQDVTTMQFIATIAAEALSWSWWMWAIPISILLGMLCDRPTSAPIWGVLAVVVQFVGVTIGNGLLAGVPLPELMAQVTAKTQNLEVHAIVLLFIEYFIFTYVIATISLTRDDIARQWPPANFHTKDPSKDELLKLAREEGV